MGGSDKNDYLEEVEDQRVQLEQALKARSPSSQSRNYADYELPQQAGEPAMVTHAPAVRVTGFWRWRTVVVPPNVYVVHTRRGHDQPLHLGLGVSFRFDPYTDSFLVVPAAMQTIIIHAKCICRERQGVVVQAYVQWIINDFQMAYRKLDFTDEQDPMRVVNVQLREQAEAAIKDKVATMSIDDVLSDKQPIIKELTARLRHVAEGDSEEEGLGLKIVTVQIKEAVVCSPKVWEMIQRPFRSQRSREARLAELENEAIVRSREAEHERTVTALRVQTEEQASKLRAETDARQFDRTETERARRAEIEAQALEGRAAQDRARAEAEAALARQRLEHELQVEKLRADANHQLALRQLELEAARWKMRNDVSPAAVQMELVRALPLIADKLPKADNQTSVTVGGDGVSSLLAGLTRLVDKLEPK